MNNNEKYKYVYVEYIDMPNDKLYCYLTDIDELKKDDIVLVERGYEEVYGRVVNIIEYNKNEVPYPIDKMKYISKIKDNKDIDITIEDTPPKYTCPKCGNHLVEIIYGMPTYETYLDSKQKKLKIAGCKVTDNDPELYCYKCKKNYYIKNLIDKD